MQIFDIDWMGQIDDLIDQARELKNNTKIKND